MNNKILHIMVLDKFIPPYINLINENFRPENHKFFLGGKPIYKYGLTLEHDVFWIDSKLKWLQLAVEMYRADKIVIHGLWMERVTQLLFMQPWLLKKCVWVMWGGDLYSYKLAKRNIRWYVNEFFRRPVIKNMGYFTTTVPGDYDLAIRWYDTKAKYIENLMYDSHVYRDAELLECKDKTNMKLNIQIGNSSDPSNNHFEMIDQLEKYKNLEIMVFCPLSYGSEMHRDKVIEYGTNKLGNIFVPMTDFMKFDDYNLHIACMDIAIFNHDRQQAMGNIIALLSLGKKVYLKSSQTPFNYFKNLGIEIFPIEEGVSLEKLSKESIEKNKFKIKVFFTKERLINSWKEVFND